MRVRTFFSRASTFFWRSAAWALASSASRVRVLSLVSAEVRSLPSLTAFSVVRSRFLFNPGARVGRCRRTVVFGKAYPQVQQSALSQQWTQRRYERAGHGDWKFQFP